MSEQKSLMPAKLSLANKRLYKKSLAKMMIFWIINTRRPLLQQLTKRQHQEWQAEFPELAKTFVDKKGKFDTTEWQDFLEFACQTVEDPFMQLALNKVNDAAFESWVQRGPDGEIIDLDCPSSEAMNLMFKAFAKRVDALPATATPPTSTTE